MNELDAVSAAVRAVYSAQEEARAAIVRAHDAGHPTRMIAIFAGISKSQVHRIVRERRSPTPPPA